MPHAHRDKSKVGRRSLLGSDDSLVEMPNDVIVVSPEREHGVFAAENAAVVTKRAVDKERSRVRMLFVYGVIRFQGAALAARHSRVAREPGAGVDWPVVFS